MRYVPVGQGKVWFFMKTEYEMYGTRKDRLGKHLFCERCGMCVDCKDCECKNPK